jgi:hypothetical protein
MQTSSSEQIEALLAVASGDVSYQSEYSKTTACMSGGRWLRKVAAWKYRDEVLEAERRAVYVAPTVPKVGSGPRSMPYTGPFPRGKHSHRCKGCETRNNQGAVACYKSQCTRPQLTATCSWCRDYYSGQ